MDMLVLMQVADEDAGADADADGDTLCGVISFRDGAHLVPPLR